MNNLQLMWSKIQNTLTTICTKTILLIYEHQETNETQWNMKVTPKRASEYCKIFSYNSVIMRWFLDMPVHFILCFTQMHIR